MSDFVRLTEKQIKFEMLGIVMCAIPDVLILGINCLVYGIIENMRLDFAIT